MIKTDLLRNQTLTVNMISSVESIQEDPSFYSYSSEGLGDALSAIWDGIVKVFKWIGQKIGDFFNWLFDSQKPELDKFWDEDYEFTGDALKPKTWVKLIGKDAVKAANKDALKTYEAFTKQANASADLTNSIQKSTKDFLDALKKIDTAKDNPQSVHDTIMTVIKNHEKDGEQITKTTYLGGSKFEGTNKKPTEAEIEEAFKSGKKIEFNIKFVAGDMDVDDVPEEFEAKTSFALIKGLVKDFAKITKEVFDDVRDNGKAFKARCEEITKITESISEEMKKKDDTLGKGVAFLIRVLMDGVNHKESVAGYIYIGKKMNDAVQFLNKYAKKKSSDK